MLLCSESSTRGSTGTKASDPRSALARSGKLSPGLLCNFIMLSEFKLYTSLTRGPNGHARFSTYPITHYNNMGGFLKRHVLKVSLWALTLFFLSLGDTVSTLFITTSMGKLFSPFCSLKHKHGSHTLYSFSPWRHRKPFNHPVTTTFTLFLPFLSGLSSSVSISRSHLDNCTGNILCNIQFSVSPCMCICILKYMAFL